MEDWRLVVVYVRGIEVAWHLKLCRRCVMGVLGALLGLDNPRREYGAAKVNSWKAGKIWLSGWPLML